MKRNFLIYSDTSVLLGFSVLATGPGSNPAEAIDF
jgi:hypothetical protein